MLAIFVIAGLPSVAVASSDVPALTGGVVVHATATAEAQLYVEREMDLPADHLDLEVHDATFAFVGLAPDSCPPAWNTTCISHQVYWAPGIGAPVVIASNPSTISPGILDVFVVTDGSVDLRMRFDDLGGESAVWATKPMTGGFSRLTDGCSARPGCSSTVAFGGASRSVERAFVASLVFWSMPDGTTPALPDPLLQAKACVYRDLDAGAPHPTGCDFADLGNPARGAATLAMYPEPFVLGLEIEDDVTNVAYTGFVASCEGTKQAVVSAFGVWVDRGAS